MTCRILVAADNAAAQLGHSLHGWLDDWVRHAEHDRNTRGLGRFSVVRATDVEAEPPPSDR